MKSEKEFVVSVWTVPVMLSLRLSGFNFDPLMSKVEMISAAAEFTRNRLEEIRQIQQEIAWASFAKSMSIKPESIECADRVLVRLKAECDDLRKEMREDYFNGLH